MLSDTSYLVRGYATLTIADILANISEDSLVGKWFNYLKITRLQNNQTG